MAPIMFIRRMMRPTILQRETRANRQRGEKAVERGDTQALVRRCFRLAGKHRDFDFLIRELLVQHHAYHLRQRCARFLALSPLLSRLRERRKVVRCANQTCAHNLPPESVDNRRPSPPAPT